MIESIGLMLVPYSEQLVNFAVTVTSLQFLSGIFVLNDIRKDGNTKRFPVEPFLGGTVLSLLSLKYGALLNDEGLIQVNFYGLALNLIYSIVYYFYTENEHKMAIWKKMGYFGLFSIVCLAWVHFEDKDKIEFRFGILLTGILVFLVGSPLLNLGEIMRKKSTEGLPFPIILSGSVVSFAWLLYSLSLFNTVLVVQNLILLVLSLIQLSLFVIYPTRKSTAEDKKSN